jgi:hypothetical protein
MRKNRMATMTPHAALPCDRADCRSPHRPAVRGLRRRRAGAAGALGKRILARAGLVIVLAASAPALAQGELGINLYGLSYHFERERARELGFDNEVNPGLGVRWRMPGEKFDSFLDAGAYRDSGRNTAALAGGGIFWKATERLRLGGAVALFYSQTYNDGNAFIAPLPLLAYEWRAVTANLVYFPKVSSINEINTLGFWLTFWPKSF